MPQTVEICLRTLKHCDLGRTLMWMQDPDIYRPFLRPEPVTQQQHLIWFETARLDPQQCLFAIDFKGTHVGNTGLKGIDLPSRSAEFWLYIGEKSAHGLGIATAATRLLLKHAFETLALDRVWLRVATDNRAAQNVYLNVGFTIKATVQDDASLEGRPTSCLRMEISRAGVQVQ